jgi:aspartate 1-decarboxylase
MLITVCTGKLHRVRVTDARLDYEGSVTIDRKLMKAAGIVPFQLVHINSLANAVHWETYAIPGEAGEICLNGCPARLFQPGDKVIILALAQATFQEAAQVKQKVVHVDDDNKILRTVLKSATSIKTAHAANDERKNGRSPAIETR